MSERIVPKYKHRHFIDRTGQRYGKLHVIGYAGPGPKGSGSLWRCRCDCGTEKLIRSGCLRGGTTISCGCVSRERLNAGRQDYNNRYSDNGDGSTTLTILRKSDGSLVADVLIDTADVELVSQRQWHVGHKQYIHGAGNDKLHVLLAGTGADHADLNVWNNCRANLRPATAAQQSQNRRKRSDSRNRFKGIARSKLRWRAEITVNGTRINLGQYPTDVEAARVYDAAAIKYHGQFARLNFPPSNEHDPSRLSSGHGLHPDHARQDGHGVPVVPAP